MFFEVPRSGQAQSYMEMYDANPEELPEEVTELLDKVHHTHAVFPFVGLLTLFTVVRPAPTPLALWENACFRHLQ